MAALSNIRWETFCQEWLIDLNQKQAYIRAGYSTKNAEGGASALCANPKVRARMDELIAERSKRTGVTADRVVRELARLAFADITDVVDTAFATVRTGAARDDTAAIASIKVKSGEDFTEREVKIHDKNKSLETLAKHLGMLTDRVAIVDDRPTIVDNIPGGGGNG